MTSKQLSILLLGGGRKVSLSGHIKERGKHLGFDVTVFSYDLSKEVPVHLEAEVIKGLPWNDTNVVEDICNIVRDKHIDIILPMVNGSIEVASMCKVRLPNVFIPVTDFSIAKPLFDKSDAAKLFKDEGFPIPRTYTVLTAKMPAIAKPRKGSKARGIQIFHDMEDFMHLHNLAGYHVQEYIQHRKEYTVDSYIDNNGKILVSVPRERLEVMGGESTRTKTCKNEFLQDFSKTVIEKLNLRGPVNIQYIYDLDTDRYLLMEVNPRLGGGVICSILAGAPIIDYIIQEATGMDAEPCSNWLAGTMTARYLKEAVFYPEN